MASGSGSHGDKITETIGERIEKALALALKAHRTPDKHYLSEKVSSKKINPSEVFISFPGSGSIRDWYSQKPFGEGQIDLNLFPSLKSIGNNEAAMVNEAFQRRFQLILAKSSLKIEVGKAMDEKKKKQIVFTGHSSGAPMAILATLWTLENYFSPKSHGGLPPLCVTFGSPLVGDHIFSHATRRENWSDYFLHFVMRYDIVPRISLAPPSCFDQRFEAISQSFNPKNRSFMSESIGRSAATTDFYFAVMSNAATVTSHAAFKLMGSTDKTLETLANFVPLSPYRPFGTYIFCVGHGKQVVIRNPDAVLQLLFFSAQLSTEAEAAQVANRSLQEHVISVTILQQMQNVVHLCQDQLHKLPLNDDGSLRDDISMALNDLGLSTRARLCLRAAAELENRRLSNEKKLNDKKDFLDEKLKEVEKYKEHWEHHDKLGYYDAFRRQDDPKDFQANVKRLELAGVWDAIIEKLRNYELPDEFEANHEWIELGTRFRRLVEPLDVANYYRHLRQVEAGTYLVKGRPRRYRYPQRWLERDERTKAEEGGYSESCLWAEVEDLRNITADKNYYDWSEDVKERVVKLEGQIMSWIKNKELGDKDVLLEGSTFVKWWKALPEQHTSNDIRNLIEETNKP